MGDLVALECLMLELRGLFWRLLCMRRGFIKDVYVHYRCVECALLRIACLLDALKKDDPQTRRSISVLRLFVGISCI